MHPGLLLLVLSLATYRLTRLLVKDAFPFVRIPRERIEAWATADPRFEAIGDLATCSWCASGWIAMALVAGVDLLSHTPVPLPPVMWAAVWAVAALVAWAEGRLEPDPDAKILPAVVHLTTTSRANGSDDATARIGTTGLVDMGVPRPVGGTYTGSPEDYDG